MKQFYIRDCSQQENQTITSYFVVASKQVKAKKNGEVYLSLVLADRSGQLQANMWDNVSDALDAFEQSPIRRFKLVLDNLRHASFRKEDLSIFQLLLALFDVGAAALDNEVIED